jgi:amidase
MMDELFYTSATDLARRIRERQISSEEVVRAHLERIDAVNARLNAVVQLAADQSMARCMASHSV